VLSALKNISEDDLNVGFRMNLKHKGKQKQIGVRLTAFSLWIC
jgi:hypothetical protein